MDDQQIAIGNFQATHSDALTTAAHPEHGLRVAELTKLFEAKFGGGVGERQAGADSSNPPAAAQPTFEDGARDRVGGSQPADDLARLAEPARQPSDYDFSKLPDQAPFGVEVEKNTELEGWSREWLHAGEISPAEGQALSTVYAESLAWDAAHIERMGQQTERDLRMKYGPDTGAAAAAALKVASELPGLSSFLDDNGLMNHPRVIANLITAAEKRGYFKRSA